MKKHIAYFIALVGAVLTMSSMPAKNGGYEIPISPNGMKEQIVRHTGLTISFNNQTLNPNWVAWDLTSQETEGNISRKGCEFQPDDMVAVQYRVKTKDYTGSGYDRGHMCPAADMKWSAAAMHACHFMTNICPQVPELNQHSWEKLESSCRRWAKQEGKIYIVCGPVYDKGRKHKTIGKDHIITVPTGFFKVVLSMKKGNEKAIGFYYSNRTSSQTMQGAARSVDEIEKLTGINFFASLPDNVENKLEATYNLSRWK